MQRLLFNIMAPAFVCATFVVSELLASTFGGSTGPRQGAENLPRISVDNTVYQRTKLRLSVDNVAPLTVPCTLEEPKVEPKTPCGSFTVTSSDKEIVEYNNTFLVVPKE